MRDLVMLDWMVPECSWQDFRNKVQSEHGSVEGYLGRKAADAMDEFSEADGYETVEDQIDRLVRAAGRTPKDRCKEKKSADERGSPLSSETTTRVTIRVDKRVKERFKSAADDSAFDSYGVAFGRALELYCDGGRASRLEDKLDRVVDDAEAVLSQLNESESTSDRLSAVERRTITICHRLGEQFTDDELTTEIADVAGSSEPTVEKYRERVVSRLGYEPHPKAQRKVWVPADVAKEIATDGVPREIRRPVDLLDRDERVERIKLALGKHAGKCGGQARASATDIRSKVFDHNISLSSVLDLLNQVALEDGYKLDRSGETTTIGVNVAGGITDETLAETIREYISANVGSLLGETTETTMSDWTDNSDPSIAGTSGSPSSAATDGGGPAPRGDRDD
ncbi:hypothetical protein NC662_20335 [Haloarcula tradensis]|uniref:Uncharacterized protein n=2 Tax=Haloarcula argentinensis TaxID=43776 RepID=A0ABU2F7C2_HALAR|nr:hypothetical protein [Haloarcula argentinensis]MDS0256050.1 hypothetical protein [Haloarcula argentinensis]